MPSTDVPPTAEPLERRSALVRHRVPISAALFAGLAIFEIATKSLPRHSPFDLHDPLGALGLGLILLGLAIRSWAAGVLRKGFDLTIEGPYSLCRHPLYLGSFLMMLGFCVVIDHWYDYVVLVLPVTVIYRLTILSEERKLARTYVDRWPPYAERTPRFIPWKLWNYLPCEWSIAQWKKSREYQAVLSTSAGIAALEIWRRSGGFY